VPRRLGVLAASLFLCVGVLPACGGDDDENGNGAAETTTTTATAAATGGAERLSEPQWAEYKTSETAFRDANQTATTRLNACEKTAGASAEQFDTCMGDTLANVTQASGDLRATLDGFEGEVGGACEAARATFSGYLRNYEATANQLDDALGPGDTPAFSAGVQNIKTVAAAGAPARDAFESDCRPA
jgi:hypothetical protein